MASPQTTVEPPEPYKGNPGSLAIIILSVIIPGLVLLTCLLTSVFLCWYRDRIPIFRNSALKYLSPAAKTRVPYSETSSHGYPTQTPPTDKKLTSKILVEGGDNWEDVSFKEDTQEFETVQAVRIEESSKL